jgi:hypothetical protein
MGDSKVEVDSRYKHIRFQPDFMDTRWWQGDGQSYHSKNGLWLRWQRAFSRMGHVVLRS